MTLSLLAVAWVAGIYLAVRFEVREPAIGLFLLASLLLMTLLVSVRRSPLPALLPVALLLGALSVGVFGGDQTSFLAAYHSRLPVQVEGVVVQDPESAGPFTRLRLRVDKINADDDWVHVQGDVLVTLRESAQLVRLRAPPYFRYGDRLRLEGPLEAPEELEDFDYPALLARQGIDSVMPFPQATLLEEGQGAAFYSWLYGVRRRVSDSLGQVVPEPQASLGQALLLGLRDSLPEELVEDFRVTGTSHVLAISGLHVSILLGIGLALSRRVFGRRHSIYLILPFALMWLYALISGMSPSVTRAAIMGSVYIAALLLGRPRSVLPALGFAAAVMVALDPNTLWSVSFQLSFAAMIGIAVLSEPLSRRLQGLFAGRPGSDAGGRGRYSYRDPDISGPTELTPALTTVFDIVAMTIAATVATLPLIAFYFQRVSLVGLPTTVLALPALPLVLVTQAVAGLLGLLSTAVAQPFGWLAWAATSYLTGVVGIVAKLPGASVETGGVAPLLVWAYYGVFVLLYAVAKLRRIWQPGLRRVSGWSPSLPMAGTGVSWWVIGPAISLAALLWIAALSLPDSRLHVTFVDVGQGDAAFITTPSGQQVLVDGGPDPLEMVRHLGANMPFRDRTIELVVLTHAHSDHVTGLLEVLRRYDVRRVLERKIEYDSPPYQAWRRALEEEGAEVIQAEAGQLISVGDGVFIQVVSPPARLLRGTASDVDNASVVLRVVYGSVSFLLAADMFREGEALLVSRNAAIATDVLKVGHHGSRSSSSSAFLDSVSPAVAVISAGEDNRFGHPHPEALEALRQHVPEELLLLTRDSGTIEFVTDGERLQMKTER